MKLGKIRVNAGMVSFALQHRYLDGGAPHRQGAGGNGGNNPTQGVCIQVVGQSGGTETELLRFDCFDDNAHYHYGPANKNERIMLDPIVTGNPIGWTVKQLRSALPAMLKRAGYTELADQVDVDLVAQKLPEVESTARQMAVEERDNVIHNRGNPVIAAGNIRFGLEMRTVGKDGGPAIHVLGDVAGQEIELLAFDCFGANPHYHYGPRYKNERIFIDRTVVPDMLSWTLDLFKKGKLPTMLRRAGYPTIATALDEDLVRDKIDEVESTLRTMAAASAA